VRWISHHSVGSSLGTNFLLAHGIDLASYAHKSADKQTKEHTQNKNKGLRKRVQEGESTGSKDHQEGRCEAFREERPQTELSCLCAIAATSADPELKSRALGMGRRLRCGGGEPETGEWVRRPDRTPCIGSM
jgi:hypothetical protein